MSARPDQDKKLDHIEGRNAVYEALAAGRPINKLWVLSPEGGKKPDPALIKTMKLADDRGVPVTRVPRNTLDKMSDDKRHQGVIAAAAAHEYSDLDEVIAKVRSEGRDPFIVICDELKDSYNLGSILRISDAAGVDAVVIPERRSVAVDSNVAKASAGAVEYVPVCRVTNIATTIRDLKEDGFWIAGCDMDGDTTYDKADYAGSFAVVIGSEGSGIRDGVVKSCDFMISIPMTGHVNSLNAAVAAGIVIFEAARMRREGKRS